MIVITADQVGSRVSADLVSGVLDWANGPEGPGLLLPADRTAGDELQLLPADARAALRIVLHLTRTGRWSVGCGIGSADPLGATVRETAGAAFVYAREAVERAKKRPRRFALENGTEHGRAVDALVDLLLVVRARRSREGWELHDLLETGLTQAEAAERLGITPQAASKRARAADLRADTAASAALVTLIADLDAPHEEGGRR